MDFSQGSSTQDEFKKFLMEDYHHSRQKQPKMSKISAQPRYAKKPSFERHSSQNEESSPNVKGTYKSRESMTKHTKKQRTLRPIPEEGNKTPQQYPDNSYLSKGDSSSYYVPPSFKPLNSSQTSDNYPYQVPPSNTSGTGTNPKHQYFRMLQEQNDEDIYAFTRKMFSFISLQKILMGIFIIYVYNNVPFTVFIGKSFYIFAIAAFVYLTILMLVHTALDLARRSPMNHICYILFTISEAWVIAFLLATTDSSTVFLFATSLAGSVLAVSIFLNTKVLSWFRGIIAVFLMVINMFLMSVLTLNYTDMITIFVCMSGSFLFGIFLLGKAFSLLKSKYTHSLQIEDYVIGSLTIYADFGFVLLIMLFIMLAMLKGFTS